MERKNTFMKKLKVLVAIVSLLIAGNVSMAQTKIGYIDAETLLYLMPEVGKIDSLVRLYQIDTVAKEYSSLIQTYQYKDSILRDSVHPAPPAVKQQIQKELAELGPTLQNWQQIGQEAVQNKQNQLLAPVMRKINDAINAVAKEKGYTYVLSRESILVAPDGDNMLQAVAKKLNITLPPQLLPGYKPPTGIR
jgi:outer membrane protein